MLQLVGTTTIPCTDSLTQHNTSNTLTLSLFAHDAHIFPPLLLAPFLSFLGVDRQIKCYDPDASHPADITLEWAVRGSFITDDITPAPSTFSVICKGEVWSFVHRIGN